MPSRKALQSSTLQAIRRLRRPRLPRIVVARTVVDRFTREIAANPHVEVGGKYVGFISGGGRRYGTLKERWRAMRNLVFEVTDYIDDGPRAHRLSGFHLGDAEWQTRRFRSLERLYPDIEHLGSWHSHHPNGLDRLSEGDIAGYRETVNSAGHNHDYFLVSLGIDTQGFATARHYLFVRGDRRFYEIPRSRIAVLDIDTGAVARRARADHVAGLPESRPVGAEPVSVPGWSESPDGRRALIEEFLLRREPVFAGLRLLVSGGRLIAKGRVSTDQLTVAMTLLYPSAYGLQDGLLKLATVDEPLVEATLSGPYTVGLRDAHGAIRLFERYVSALRSYRSGRQLPDWVR